MNIWQILMVNGIIGILAQILLFKVIERNTADDVGKEEAERLVDEAGEESLDYAKKTASQSIGWLIFGAFWFLMGIFAWELTIPVAYIYYSWQVNEKLPKKDKDS